MRVMTSSIRTRRPSRPATRVLLLVALLGASCRPVLDASGATWHRNGVRRSEGEVDARGRPTGPWFFWYANGELREAGSFEAGHRAGRWIQYHPNGALASRGNRRWDPERDASPRHGPWSFWYSNGRLRARGAYAGGLRVGPWEYRYDSGRLDERRSGHYADDRRVADL